MKFFSLKANKSDNFAEKWGLSQFLRIFQGFDVGIQAKCHVLINLKVWKLQNFSDFLEISSEIERFDSSESGLVYL